MGISKPPHSTTPEHQYATFCKCRYCLIAPYPCLTWPSYITLMGWVLHLCAHKQGKLGRKPSSDIAAAPRGDTSRARLMAKILAKGLFHTRPLPTCSLCLAADRLGFGALNLEKAKRGHGDRDASRGWRPSIQKAAPGTTCFVLAFSCPSFTHEHSLPLPRSPDLSHFARVSCKITD